MPIERQKEVRRRRQRKLRVKKLKAQLDEWNAQTQTTAL